MSSEGALAYFDTNGNDVTLPAVVSGTGLGKIGASVPGTMGVSAVPEPSIGLLGVAGLALLRRRRRAAVAAR